MWVENSQLSLNFTLRFVYGKLIIIAIGLNNKNEQNYVIAAF